MRISKVITRTGDDGKTGLGDGQRVSKNDIRIHVLGSIDELNSFIGSAKIVVDDSKVMDLLESVQNDLFNIGGCISIPDSDIETVDEERIKEIESIVENWNSKLPSLKEFILPGGTEASSKFHIVRSQARQTERNLVALHESHPLPNIWLKYFNRLSDLFFVLARTLQKDEGVDEKQWEHK